MRKYPVIKCNKELWEEIKKQLDIWNISYNISNNWNEYSYLVSNYGCPQISTFEIGNTCYYENEDINEGYRYLVNTKEEFLLTVAKLLNKEYTMEERNIKVSLEKARKWYNSNNDTLKELALQAFKEEELTSFENILSCVAYNNISYKTSTTQKDKWSTLHKLAIIAEYLNDGWRPNWIDRSEEKYYILMDFQLKRVQIAVTYSCNHGYVYFKTKELAGKAVKILGEEIKYMFD